MTTGTLTTIGQHDWLATTLEANQGYLFTFTGLDEYAFVDAGPSSVISDAVLTNVQSLQAAGTTTTLFYEPATTETIYLDISDSGGTGTFTASGTQVATDYTDNISTKGLVTIGGPATTGTLASPGQDDWLAVSLVANQAYLFTITGLSGIDVAGEAIFDTIQVGPAADLDDTLGFSNYPFAGTIGTALVFYEASTTGTYYLDLSDGDTTSAYSVTGKQVAVDYTDNASTTGHVTIGGAATTGSLASPGQHDWLALSLTANQGYEFSISGLDQNAVITAGPSSGLNDQVLGPAAIPTSSTAEISTLFYEPGTTGTYYLDISDEGHTAAYSVTGTTVSVDYTDNVSTKGSIAVGGTATTGNLATAGQHDWLAVALTANQGYLFTLSGLNGFAAVEVGPASGLNDSVLTSSSSSIDLGLVGSLDAFYEPGTSGTYYLNISSFYGNTGSYSVSGAKVATDYTDNATTKGTVVIGGAATTGTIATFGQHDWLELSLVANQGYYFTVSGLDEASLEVGPAADLNDSVLSGVSPLNLGGLGQSSTAQAFYEPAATGTYYLDISDVEETGTYSVTGVAVSTDYADNTSTTGTVATPCFAAGTRIATDRGDVAVENLRVGDRARLNGGGFAPVVWLGSRHVVFAAAAATEAWPVRVRAQAFGAGQPRCDLVLSPDHAVFAEGVLIPIRYLVNGTTVVEDKPVAVTYWHVELDRHDVLLAEGLACESYLDTGNRGAFGPGNVAFAAEGESEAIWESFGCAPLHISGPCIERLAMRLRRRAAQIGHQVPATFVPTCLPDAETTTNLLRLLQPAWYLARYPDVQHSGIDAATHYALWGMAEGRLPCAPVDVLRRLSLVEAGSVAACMPDVVAAGMDPVSHYYECGGHERRRPNLYFDTGWYLDRFEVPPGVNPLVHYIVRGERLGLPPSRHFDPVWYRNRYDIASSTSPLAHYLAHRRSGAFSPVPTFDVKAYLRAHTGTLIAARDPYAHYLATRRSASASRQAIAA